MSKDIKVPNHFPLLHFFVLERATCSKVLSGSLHLQMIGRSNSENAILGMKPHNLIISSQVAGRNVDDGVSFIG